MSLSIALKIWRRRFKSKLPYVRRREHSIVQRKYRALIDNLWAQAPRADEVAALTVKPIVPDMRGEVCLFVSFAPTPTLKPHVRSHIDHLLRAGIQVVLIVNTELAPERILLEPGLIERLSGVLVRQNLGYDFAAWAHALALAAGSEGWTRLFLINDSIVGPLDAAAFDRVMARVRSSPADVLGLTRSADPPPHLQSFFLVFNRAALQSGCLQRACRRVVCLPNKTLVIDVYERGLTTWLTQQGLRCEALFRSPSDNPFAANATDLYWDVLIDAGFPYIKASVLAQCRDSPKLRDRVPAEFLAPGA
jgi:hypothetical protein